MYHFLVCSVVLQLSSYAVFSILQILNFYWLIFFLTCYHYGKQPITDIILNSVIKHKVPIMGDQILIALLHMREEQNKTISNFSYNSIPLQQAILQCITEMLIRILTVRFK